MALLPDKEKLLRNFLRCANWEEKYLYIIELGQRLPELRDEDKSPQNSIQGCGNDSNLLIVFYVQIMPDDFVMQLHRF